VLLEAVCLQITFTFKEPTIVRRYPLLATILNLKNNLIPILSLRRQSILKEFDLLTLALTPKGKPSGLKDYNNLNKIDINKVDTNNVLSFINYIITDK
jgi:hypothetical protein